MADYNAENPSSLPFDQMILARTKAWTKQYDEPARPRLEQSIELTFRNRSDYFGYLYSRGKRTEWRAFTGKGMVTYPVIGRSIRSKIATSCSTRIQTEVEAVRDLPEKQAAAELAKNILRFDHEHNWTKETDATVAELCQIQRYCWIYKNYQTKGGMLVDVPVTKKVEKKIGDTLYTCSDCGFQSTPEDIGIPDFADEFKDSDLAASDIHEGGPESMDANMEPSMDGATAEGAALAAPSQDIAVDAEYQDDEYLDEEAQKTLEHTASIACPYCKTNTLVLDSRARHETIDAFTGEYEKRDCGFMDSRFWSPLLTRIDSYPCLGFQYKRAAWFNYHPLVPAYELIAIAPHLKDQIETGAGNWSESARWHYDLNNTTSSSAGYSYNSSSYRMDELVEPNVWWIAPHACVGWESPDEYKLHKWAQNEAGEWNETEEALFTIKEGETIEQACMRETGEEFRGLLVVLWKEHLIAVGNEFFTEKVLGIPWKIDSQSFFPQGEENMLKLQNAATNILSMVYSHVLSATIPNLVADPLGGFNEKSIQNKNTPGNVIYRNPVSADVTNRDWSHFLGYLQPGSLGGEVANFVQLIIDIAKEESGVFNETVGNTQETDETLGGRRMALTQSLGLMTPQNQGKAVGMIESDYITLEQWARNAPDEAFALIKGTFEEEWKPQDIEAFRALDIRRELFVTLVEGTDIPKTQVEMEAKFVAALNAGLFDETNPIPLQIRSHIVKSVLGIDFDLGNYSAYKRLASRRYENLKEEMSALTPNEAFTVITDASGFPVRKLRPEILASIAQDVRTAPRGTDQHLVFIEFYTDKLNGLVGAKMPDEIMVAVCEEVIDMHRAYVAALSAQANAVAGAAAAAGNTMANTSGGQMPAPAPAEGGASQPTA